MRLFYSISFRECHHSFPILAPPLHVQASRLTAWRSEPLPTIHRSSTIQRGSPFDEIPDTGPPTFVSAYSKTNPPMHSYPSYYTDAGGVLYPRPSMNKMGNNANLNNACLSQSNIKFPVASVVDPDTEITEGGDLPFEKLVVVPIQGKNISGQYLHLKIWNNIHGKWMMIFIPKKTFIIYSVVLRYCVTGCEMV